MRIIPITSTAFQNNQNKKDRYAAIILRSIMREEQKRKQQGREYINTRINILV